MHDACERGRHGAESWPFWYPRRSPDRRTDDPALKRHGQRDEALPIHDKLAVRRLARQAREVIHGDLFKPEILFTKDVGLPSQHLDNGRVEFLQDRHQLLTDTVPQIDRLRIARIHSPW